MKKNNRTELSSQTGDILNEAYWETPPLDLSLPGDPDHSGIYIQVGSALSQWEMVEDMIAHLYILTIGTHDAITYKISQQVFGILPSNSLRIKALETALSVRFGQFWKEDIGKKHFRRLKAVLLAASRRRNEIAHGVASHHTVNDVVAGTFLMAPSYDTDRNEMHPSYNQDDVLGFSSSRYRYNANTLGIMANKFSNLKYLLIDYSTQIQIKENGLPKCVVEFIQNKK